MPLMAFICFLFHFSSVEKKQLGSVTDFYSQRLDNCADELEELLRREKEAGVTPDPELDAFMRAEVRTGKQESIVTDLVIKMLGLDVGGLHAHAAPHLSVSFACQVQLFTQTCTSLD